MTTLSLSTGAQVELEKHANTETPRFYPEKIIRLKMGPSGLSIHTVNTMYLPPKIGKNWKKSQSIQSSGFMSII